MLFDQPRLLTVSAILASALLIAGCSSSDDDPAPAPDPTPAPPATTTFEVTVSNLTNAQPLSPVAIIAHRDGYAVFTVGAPATVGLETLAEGGDNAALIGEADADALVLATASGMAPIGPAASEAITFEVLESELPGLLLSTSTMLVNTNDAITGSNSVTIGDMAIGDVISLRTIAYDSGTEANTELAIHIPGPAGGGEGFNAVRDDLADRVTMHTGVVSRDDGFAMSDLTDQHRFDNSVAAFRIERIN
ncbi:MAG: spondin domain-containing protein [Woeseiaceae bacterium]|nr:spondin domain-containing protein [Woeseiaceae bacterium]